MITAFLALTGLIYVYLTVQLHHLGDRKKALENELTNLRAQNDVTSVQIAALTSRSALQRRLKEGYLKMIPIAEQQHRALERAGASVRRRCRPTGRKQTCRQMKWNSRIRCALVCLAFTALFSAFSFRLVYLQMIKHDEYAGLAAEKHVYKQSIFAERGAILDANNEVLAHNIPVETVVADATHLNNREALIPLAARHAGAVRQRNSPRN